MLLRQGRTWLMLMPLLLSLSTGELSFYRDVLAETSEDIALKHLARYLEAQHRIQHRLHRSHLPTFLSPVHKKHSNLQLDRPKELLYDRKATLDNFKQKLSVWLAQHYRANNRYHEPIVDQIERVRIPEYLLSYYNVDYKHPDYTEERQSNVDDVDRLAKDHRSYDEGRTIFDVDGGAIDDEPAVNFFHGKFVDHDHTMDVLHHEGGRVVAPARPTAMTATVGPEFTYKFDNANLEEKHPFAVKPNDPRYYTDATFSSDDIDWQDVSSNMDWKGQKIVDKERMPMKHDDDMRSVDQKTLKDLAAELDVLESERSTGRRPLIVPMNQDLNSDIYFIAIVAGCSAAAMFTLVLISLTWCRLQRGAKAAADIEYPAYGVTGPNKDVSPSGDQRLAQSAQMYHFQHQKQQIIAMENRTSATRDPGSLSEAESDEENEEGDYTVYECPGLASTGEMEVKNPMFHDDPTPATPITQSTNKEEDHI